MTMTVTGLFDRVSDAQAAVQEFVEGGWTHESISVVTKEIGDAPTEESRPKVAGPVVKDAEKGAVIGGLAGLLLGMSELAVPGVGPVLVGGWLATTLLGVGLGAATGGLAGTLVELGMSHEHAAHLAGQIRQGATLVTVRTTEDTASQARDILARQGALHIHEGTAD